MAYKRVSLRCQECGSIAFKLTRNPDNWKFVCEKCMQGDDDGDINQEVSEDS